MMTKQAQPALLKPAWREHESSDHDPARLGVTLRDLASRAHQLVRAVDGHESGFDGSDAEEELALVHAQIVRLERHLGPHQAGDLATYVSALRARVEECLA